MKIDLASLHGLYEADDQIRSFVAHSLSVLKCVRGGLRMALQNRLEFDPRADFWRRPERRLALSYLGTRWTGQFAPPVSLRSFAVDLLQYAERAKRDGIITYEGV